MFVTMFKIMMIILCIHVDGSDATEDLDVTITFDDPEEETNDREGFNGSMQRKKGGRGVQQDSCKQSQSKAHGVDRKFQLLHHQKV